MVPANGATAKTRLDAGGVDFGPSKQKEYGTEVLPAGEKNRNMLQGENISNAHLWNYPVNNLLADQLTAQGLIQDTVRGTTSSSARREAPSAVFGMNTPGRIRSDSNTVNIGLDNRPVRVDRESGHSFVMDDGDVNGDNQLIRLRTASGHQVLLHDTEGSVYIANGTGKSWIEMDRAGRIIMYSNRGVSLRTEGDFNLHADENINFHAKKKINFTAEKDVNLNAGENLHSMAKKAIRNSSQGTLMSYAKTNIKSFTDGPQLHGAGGNIDLAGSQVHLNSQKARKGWGPSWLKPEAGQVGIITVKNDDTIAVQPFIRGRKNTKKTATTVVDYKTKKSKDVFPTHEPFDRPTLGRDKDDIA
jgi:hypothetical protein